MADQTKVQGVQAIGRVFIGRTANPDTNARHKIAEKNREKMIAKAEAAERKAGGSSAKALAKLEKENKELKAEIESLEEKIQAMNQKAGDGDEK